MGSAGVSLTGLIEARRNPLARRFDQREEEVDFGNIVRRPPIAWKPFAFIRSPYRYGCSILCNHPLDPEFRGTLRDKEIWFSGCRSPLTKEDYDRIQYMIHHIRTGSRPGSEFGDGDFTYSCDASRRNSRRLSFPCQTNGLQPTSHRSANSKNSRGNDGKSEAETARKNRATRAGAAAPSVKISRPSSAFERSSSARDRERRMFVTIEDENSREEFVVDLLRLRRTRSVDALSSATCGTTDKENSSFWEAGTERSFALTDEGFRIDVNCVGNGRMTNDDGSKRRVVARLFGERCRSSSAESTEGPSIAASALDSATDAGMMGWRNHDASSSGRHDDGATCAEGGGGEPQQSARENKQFMAASRKTDAKQHYLGTSKPKTPQKPGSATRVSTGNQQVPLPPPSPQTDHQGNNKKKLRIKRKQKRSTSPEKEYKDAALEAETQMKNLDASVSSIKPIEDTTDKEIDQPGKTGGSRGKHVTFQGSFDMDEYLLEQAARGERGNAAKNQADEDFDYDTLRELQARLKEGIRIILTKGASGDMHMEIEALRKELARRKGGDPPDTLGIPRVYDKSLVRYELPMDIAKLEGLTPLQYLEEYSFVSDSLKNLHARVYKRHRDLQPSGKFSFRALTVAMSEIMGQDWSPDDSETICKIIGATVRKAGHGDAKGESILAAVPGSDTGPSPGTASEISKGSSRSQHSALKEPAKTLSSRQSTSTSVGHESHPSPPGSPTFATSTPRLIDLLNAGRDRRMRERRLAEHAKRTEVPDIGALRSAGKPAEGHALSTLDLNQFQVVAAFAERAFCLKYAEISHNVVRCKEYVEIADFERLQEKLSYVDVSEELKNLLTLIKNT